MANEELLKSKFHGSLDYLNRLNELCSSLDIIKVRRVNCNNYSSIVNNWKTHFWILKSFFCELSEVMPKETKKLHLDKSRSIETQMNGAINSINKSSGSYIKVPNFYSTLDDWEIDLREFKSFKGLTMPDIDNNDDAADEE